MMEADCIVVFGKRPASDREPLELKARAAFAASLWHEMDSAPIIFCVEGFDISASTQSGSEIVRDVVVECGVPREYTIVSSISNCTSREVVAIRQVLEKYNFSKPVSVTHAYHVKRVARYLKEARIESPVLACNLMHVGKNEENHKNKIISEYIQNGEPGKIQVIRENLAEMILSLLHLINPQGNIERFLSDRIRGEANSLPDDVGNSPGNY